MINPYKLMNEAPTVIGMMSVVLSSGGSLRWPSGTYPRTAPFL